MKQLQDILAGIILSMPFSLSCMENTALRTCLESGDNKTVYSVTSNYKGWKNIYELELTAKDVTEITDLSQLRVRDSDGQPFAQDLRDPGKIGSQETAEITEIGDLRLLLVDVKLKQIPHGLSKLTNLTELCLNHNEFSAIPSNITTLKELRAFSIAYNDIKEIHSDFFNMKLRHLNLNHNQLTNIDPAIKKLSLLTKLALDSNRIAVIPRELFTLEFLKYLSISDNSLLRKVPAEIGKLRRLKVLRLANNAHLSELPVTLGLLTNLEQLDIHDSGIANIEVLETLQRLAVLNIDEVGPSCKLLPHLQTLHTLEKLYMGWNPICERKNQILNKEEQNPEIFREAFMKLTKLTELDLQYNRLVRVPESLTMCLTLRLLDLSGNCMSEIPAEISSLINLSTLYLSDNSLATLPDTLSQLTNLKTLSLHTNRLHALPTSLYHLTSLISLDLMHNPCGFLTHKKQAASGAMILYELAGKECARLSHALWMRVSQSEEPTLQKIKGTLDNLRNYLQERIFTPVRIPNFLLEQNFISMLSDCIPALEDRTSQLLRFLEQTKMVAHNFLPLGKQLEQALETTQEWLQSNTVCLRHAIELSEYLKLYEWLLSRFSTNYYEFSYGNPLDTSPWCELPPGVKLMILRRSFD